MFPFSGKMKSRRFDNEQQLAPEIGDEYSSPITSPKLQGQFIKAAIEEQHEP